MGEANRKRARDASDAENSIPGSHAPASPRSAHIMGSVMKALKDVYPDCNFAMFVFEPPAPGAEARYNYASTADRADMVAVILSPPAPTVSPAIR